MSRLLFILSILTLPSQAQHWSFANCIGDYGNGVPTSIAVDNNGEIIITGVFSDTLYLPAGNVLSVDMEDSYLIKYDSSGNIAWNLFLHGQYDDSFEDVAIDENNNIYVSVRSSDTIQIQNTFIYPVGNNAIYLKLDPNGNLVWFIQGSGNSFGGQIALDKLGSVYFTGLVNNDVTFDWLTLTNTAGIYNTFILICDRDSGQVLDGQMISSSGDYGALEMVADSMGSIYMVGYNRPVTHPYINFFMRRLLSASGNDWYYDMESPSGDCYGYDVSLDPFGKVYFTGYIYNNVTFMGNQFGAFGRYRNAVLTKFDTTGTLEWAMHYGYGSPDMANGVACDDSGNVYWTGSFEDSMKIGNTTMYASNSSWADAFFVKLDSSGEMLWSKNITGGNGEYPACLDFNSSSKVLGIAGTFFQPAFFDSIEVSGIRGLEVFVASMDVGPPLNVGLPKNLLDDKEYSMSLWGDLLMIDSDMERDLTIFDITGKFILSAKISSGRNEINLERLIAGVYVMKIAGEETFVSKKIIVAR